MFAPESLRHPEFSWRQALSMASASKLAYEAAPVVSNVAGSAWRYDSVHFLDRGDTQCFVASRDDHTILAFRGSESLGDWIGNLLLVATNEPDYGAVHLGFFEAYRRIADDVLSVLPTNSPIWLTGHSLGGALASLAAAELFATHQITGVYTFGQPRVGGALFRELLEQRYANRLFRFVNHHDVVCRIPPGYQHVGQLIHFAGDGLLHRLATESDVISSEMPAITESELSAMQADISGIRDSITKHRSAEQVEASLDVSVEGMIPGLQDHKLDRYIANIRRQITEDRTASLVQSKQAIVEATEGAFKSPVPNIPTPERVGIVLRLADSDWKAPENLKIGSRFATFATASATSRDLEELKSDPGVLAIELSGDAGMKELATSVPFVGGDVVHRPPVSERGDQALVGIIDTGADVLHEAFLDADGTSRILAVWNQRDSLGPSPHSLDPETFSQDYGTLYLAADIARCLTQPGTTPAALRDPDGHGTHVASIAAGRAAGPTLANGLAPDAGLIVVIPDSKTEPGSPPSLGYSVSHVDAVSFLKNAATGSNVVCPDALPIAINVSLGMNAGAHDGTAMVESAFDALTMVGRDPSCVIVKSAGNERGRGGHARVRAISNGITHIEWDSNGFRFQDYIEVWYHARDELAFELVDPAGNVSGITDESNPVVQADLGGNHCKLSLTTQHRDNGDNLLAITILPDSESIQTGRWKLRIQGLTLSGGGYVDAWVERDRVRAVTLEPDDPNMTISIPGTADSVIAVGASNTAIPFTLTTTSSYGLTRDRRPKPEVVAPGEAIIAAASNQDDHQATVAMSGTSMAAPHVTGAFALVMSGRKKTGRPQVNAQQLRGALIRHTKASGGFHNEGSGWGVLDAEALYQKLMT